MDSLKNMIHKCYTYDDSTPSLIILLYPKKMRQVFYRALVVCIIMNSNVAERLSLKLL